LSTGVPRLAKMSTPAWVRSAPRGAPKESATRWASTPATGIATATGGGIRESSHSARGLAMNGWCQDQCAAAASSASTTADFSVDLSPDAWSRAGLVAGMAPSIPQRTYRPRHHPSPPFPRLRGKVPPKGADGGEACPTPQMKNPAKMRGRSDGRLPRGCPHLPFGHLPPQAGEEDLVRRRRP